MYITGVDKRVSVQIQQERTIRRSIPSDKRVLQYERTSSKVQAMQAGGGRSAEQIGAVYLGDELLYNSMVRIAVDKVFYGVGKRS